MVPATVSYTNLGVVIPNVQVEAVYYGSAWTNASAAQNPELKQEAKDLNSFLADITQSSYMTGLAQYSGTAYFQLFGGLGLAVPYGATPGKGQFMGSDAVAGGAPNDSGNLDEITIVNSLKQEIAKGNLKAPTADTLYMVFLPPGLRSQYDVSQSFGGHHAVFTTSNGRAFYAVIDYPVASFQSTGYPGLLTNVQRLTAVASHEMVEAISDPADLDQVDSASNTGKLPAWTGAGGTEIGDITQSSPPAGGALSLVDGYVVQKYWSESAKTSVAPGGVDYAPLTQIPTAQNGDHFTLTALVAGSKPTPQLQFAITATPGLSTFTGSWQGTDGKLDNIVGTLQVSGGRSLNVTITRASDNTVLFVGILSTPNDDWSWGVELSGKTAGGVAMFGVEDYSFTPVSLWGSAGPIEGSGAPRGAPGVERITGVLGRRTY